uniref:Uncharacterized protein n=1 Tax=Panagrolaimus davidi TaxID=227884 RepID=A0A914NZV0_9BILA
MAQNTFIESIFTTAKEINCKIYASFEKYKILEFNASTASQWQNIQLLSSFFTIVIPPNSSLAITVATLPPVNFISYPHKSLWFLVENVEMTTYIPYYISSGILMKFTIVQLNIDVNSTIFFLKDGGFLRMYNITSSSKIGTSFSFTNIGVQIGHTWNIEQPNYDKAVLEIETFRN